MAKNKHPRGLMVLFFTEMWERFGYYLMLGIFTLYMIAPESATFPGLGMSNMGAADIYGTYLALVYLTPFFGGLIADRFLGYRKSIYIGGLFMAAGYFCLAIPNSMLAFYSALLLIIIGNGMFKPNVSVLLGKLYEKPEYIKLKDSGYNIFYMGINIGAFVCNFAAAYLRLTYGWGWAFAAAGLGMILGVLWFAYGNYKVPEIKEVDVITPLQPEDMPMSKILTTMFLPALTAAVIGWIIPGNIFGGDSTDAFIFFCIPLIIYFVNMVRNASKDEKGPIAALLTIFGVVIIFWAVFHQNGSALTYWAKYNTNREVKEVTESVINTIAKTEEVSTVPREIKLQGLHGEELGTKTGPNPYYDNFNEELPAGNLEGKPGDVTDEDWEKIKAESDKYGKSNLWPTELQASINPGFVILLTPLVVAFFAFLARRRREVSTPGKIALGMFISALSWFIMVAAAMYSQNGLDKASVAWLFGVYGIITFGELCLSPMGLSLVSKMAPKRLAALMMGGWFLSTAIGNKLSGILSGLWDLFEKKSNFFLTNALLTLVAFAAIALLLPWHKQVSNESQAKQQ
jgi:POT family proton-dependent oligopeptide transporter